jgi:hypothetical protein
MSQLAEGNLSFSKVIHKKLELLLDNIIIVWVENDKSDKNQTLFLKL